MPTTLDMASLEEKTRELCEFLVEQEGYQEAWRDIEAFLSDEDAKQAYRAWQERGSAMHRRQHQGVEPTEEEIVELENLKAAVMGNAVAANFVQAEGHMNRIFGTVTKMLQKTLQLGYVPSEVDLMESECCGGHGGCGCH